MQKGFSQKSIPPNWLEMSPEQAEKNIKCELEKARKNLEAIKSIKDEDLTFANSIRALDRACVDLNRAWTYLNHLESVMTSKELRDALNALVPTISEFFSSILLDEKLYAKVSAYAQTQEAKSLVGDQKILLEETLQDFQEEGANLPSKEKKRLLEINKQLSLKGQKFSENELDSTKKYSLHITDENDLKSIPQTAINIARATAKERGLDGWVFTLDRPSYAPFITYAENDNLRKEIWQASTEIATQEPFDNRPIIREMLQLRKEKAMLLSFKNYADYTLSRRMAKNGDTALAFIENLRKKFAPAFEKEWQMLQDFADKTANGTIKPWQSAYFIEKLRKEKYDFDTEQLRDYLPFDAVINGMFKIAKTLFGLDITKSSSNVGAWHKTVELYDISKDGKLLGKFYTDFVPRKQKRSGAWMNLLSPATEDSVALGVIAGNLTEPVDDKPALLSIDDTSTLFHEFGHLMHFMLMDSPELSLRNVAWDFVELPSQIMENWCSDKACLDIFASHWKTGKKIPDELFEKFKRSEKFTGAIACMRQLSFAKIDLLLHINTQDFLDADDLETKAQNEIADCSHKYEIAVPTILPRFTHLFGGGYAAGYYSYKWAEVLDADAFTRFKKEGLLNANTGKDFVEKILKVGKSISPEKAFENFMGRKPNVDALVERSLEPEYIAK